MVLFVQKLTLSNLGSISVGAEHVDGDPDLPALPAALGLAALAASPARRAGPASPSRRQAGSRPALRPDVHSAVERLPDAGAGLCPVLALPDRQPHRCT